MVVVVQFFSQRFDCEGLVVVVATLDLSRGRMEGDFFFISMLIYFFLPSTHFIILVNKKKLVCSIDDNMFSTGTP